MLLCAKPSAVYTPQRAFRRRFSCKGNENSGDENMVLGCWVVELMGGGEGGKGQFRFRPLTPFPPSTLDTVEQCTPTALAISPIEKRAFQRSFSATGILNLTAIQTSIPQCAAPGRRGSWRDSRPPERNRESSCLIPGQNPGPAPGNGWAQPCRTTAAAMALLRRHH